MVGETSTNGKWKSHRARDKEMEKAMTKHFKPKLAAPPKHPTNPKQGGGGGIKTQSRNGTTSVTTPVGSCGAIAVQSNGSIILAGRNTDVDGNYNTVLVRYDNKLVLDTAGFGNGGVVTNHAGSPRQPDYTGVAVYFDPVYNEERILAAGQIGDEATGTNQFFVARFKLNGTLDTDFNKNGAAPGIAQTGFPINIGQDSVAYNVAAQSDGSVIVAGWRGVEDGNPSDWVVVRFTRDGIQDGSFGDGGVVVLNTPEMAIYAIAVYPKVKVKVGNGFDWDPDSDKILLCGPRDPNGPQAAIVRLNMNGTVDNFGNNHAPITTNLGGGNFPAYCAVAIDDNKNIIALGTDDDIGGGNVVLARYKPDGTPDTSFGNAGTASGTFVDANGVNQTFMPGGTLAILTNGTIAAAGSLSNGHIGLARYTNGRLLPQAIAIPTDTNPDPSGAVGVVAYQNSILMGGNCTPKGGVESFLAVLV